MRASSVSQIILETLSREQVHLTSHQIFEVIRSRLPAVNPSTVYRSLERLAFNGLISVSDMGTGAAVYESLVDGQHHHLVCQQCRRVFSISHASVNAFFTQVGNESNFTVATNHLVLFGTCSDCRQPG